MKFFLLAAFVLASTNAADEAPSPVAAKGEQAARAVCQTCHVFPEPALLDRQSWFNALRRMAPLLGVARINLENRADGKILKDAHVFPDTPLVSEEDWQGIVQYYTDHAPKTALPQKKEQPPIAPDLSLFKPHPLRYPGASPDTSLVRIDAGKSRVYIGNASIPSLDLVSLDGRLISRVKLDSPPVDLTVRPEGIYLTLIGNMFPTDERNGKLVLLSENRGEISQKILLDHLGRPTTTLLSDLNGDGREDLLVCSFGNYLGKIAWYERDAAGALKEHPLLDQPGGVNAVYVGGPANAFYVLMAQAREGIHRYSLKPGELDHRLVAEFHPAFGSSHLEVGDLDGDGSPDLLLSNGDNGDYRCSFKNYHGVRILLNDGHDHFAEKWFYALNGAFKALARDFDRDGDLDIAAISFFPNYEEKPMESFVYFENRGAGNYVPHSFPGCTVGRWLTMDAGDVDGDGDADIVLGSFADGPPSIPIPTALQASWKTNGFSVLWLENQKQP